MRFSAPAFLLPAMLAAAVVPGAAADARQMSGYDITLAAASLAPGRYLWTDTAPADGAISVLISLPDQRAYVFRGETLIAASTISTGKDGKETPVGVYPILQKKEMHRSNLYDDAPMPFMQRLTWDGVALHAGSNPGFPASHGCVRLPTAFAKKLFAATQLGTTVEVTDQAYVADAAPVLASADPALAADSKVTAGANRASGDR